MTIRRLTADELREAVRARREDAAEQVLSPEIASALAQVRHYVANTMTCPCGFGEERSRKEPCACSFGGIQNGLSDLEDAIVPYLAARREVEALRAAATDCADDLEAELRNRYHYPDVHPAMQGKYERDMESVLAVRAALAATPEEK